jgi:GTPase SAR1 family protein
MTSIPTLGLVGSELVGKSTIARLLAGTVSDKAARVAGVRWIATPSAYIVDTPGDERNRLINKAYLRDCTCTILVFSLCSIASLDALRSRVYDAQTVGVTTFLLAGTLLKGSEAAESMDAMVETFLSVYHASVRGYVRVLLPPTVPSDDADACRSVTGMVAAACAVAKEGLYVPRSAGCALLPHARASVARLSE